MNDVTQEKAVVPWHSWPAPFLLLPSSPAGSATSSSPSTQVPLANFLVTLFPAIIEKKTNDLLVLNPTSARKWKWQRRSSHPSSTPSGVAPPPQACRTYQRLCPQCSGLTPLATSWMTGSSSLYLEFSFTYYWWSHRSWCCRYSDTEITTITISWTLK